MRGNDRMNTIEIQMPDQPDEQAALVERGTTWADSLTITTPEVRKEVSAGIGRLKKIKTEIAVLFRDPKKAASDAHKAICAAEKKLMQPVDDAIQTANGKLLAYDREQARIRAEQEAELRRKAEAEAEKERRRLEAIAARCKDEAKREAYEEAAEAVVPVAVAVAPAEDRAEGEVRVKRWKAELTDLNDVIAAAASGNQAAAGLLAFDQSAANRAAVAFKRDGVVPGVRFYADEAIQHRG
jgi:membrane protein involved in colicin uptake